MLYWSVAATLKAFVSSLITDTPTSLLIHKCKKKISHLYRKIPPKSHAQITQQYWYFYVMLHCIFGYGNGPAIATNVVIVLVRILFFVFFSSDLRSVEAFSFHNRSLPNFAHTWATTLSTIAPWRIFHLSPKWLIRPPGRSQAYVLPKIFFVIFFVTRSPSSAADRRETATWWETGFAFYCKSNHWGRGVRSPKIAANACNVSAEADFIQLLTFIRNDSRYSKSDS